MLEMIRELLIGYTKLLIIVAVSIIIDFITGITKAIYNKNIQSEKLRKTIPKIIGYFAVIVIGICLQIVFNVEYVPVLIMIFIIIIEFISTLENISNYVTIPNFLIKFLEEKRKLINDGDKSSYYIPDLDAADIESEVNINDNK